MSGVPPWFTFMIVHRNTVKRDELCKGCELLFYYKIMCELLEASEVDMMTL